MEKAKIVTDNKARDILCWLDLTKRERAEHDYLDTEDKQMDAEFVRYKGWCYYLNDFQGVPKRWELGDWDGYHSDSYFSGVLVRYVEQGEAVVMGTYY
jgi:hypothetical protein